MAGPARPNAAASFTVAFALTVSLFALWGLGHRFFDALVPTFAEVFRLGPYAKAFTGAIYSVVYFVGAIPAALLARRFGGKIAILLGLGAIAIGSFMLYPAAEMQVYGYFLIAIIVMATGWIFLEVAANPLAASLGPDKTFVWRLNFAQSFYPLGALAGVFAGDWLLHAHLAMPGEKNVYAIAHPYIVLGAAVLLLAFLFEEVRFPHLPGDRNKGGVADAFRRLLTNRMFLFAIFAQFASVVALAGTWASDVRALIDTLPGHPQGLPGGSIVWVLTAMAAGRFAGSALMRKIEPASLLAMFSAGGVAASLLGASCDGAIATTAVVASSFFLSITWPTILGLAIRGQGSMMKLGTALICMGGAAGGVAHQMIVVAWPFPSGHMAMVLPAFGFAAVMAYALAVRRAELRSEADV